MTDEIVLSSMVTTAGAIARSHANLCAASKALALACATGEAWEEHGAFVASSGVGLRAFNVALMARPDHTALAAIRAYFQRRGVKFRVRIREDIAVDSEVIEAAGLEPQGGIPSLVLAPIEASTRTSELEIKAVADAKTLRDHVEVVAAAFAWQPDVLGRVFTERLLEDAAWRGYVGYADDRPVAASQLRVTDGVAGIYYVATADAYRQRGFGEALTRHAGLEGAAAGCDMASLQASPMGLPVYERMGFQQVSYYHAYVLREA